MALPAKVLEHRYYPRHLVNWRVAIVNDGHEDRPIFYGRSHDVSLGGLSMLSDDNLFFDNSVIVLLALPPRNTGEREKIIEIRAHVIYTVLAASLQMFRVGVQFQEFKRDGRDVLDQYLASRISYL
jgi:c-di-GMP-binding flagellar brake protein YcgR